MLRRDTDGNSRFPPELRSLSSLFSDAYGLVNRRKEDRKDGESEEILCLDLSLKPLKGVCLGGETI